jgi:hypothetical protein
VAEFEERFGQCSRLGRISRWFCRLVRQGVARLWRKSLKRAGSVGRDGSPGCGLFAGGDDFLLLALLCSGLYVNGTTRGLDPEAVLDPQSVCSRG